MLHKVISRPSIGARTCIYDRGIGEFIRLDFPKHVCQTCMSGANLSYKLFTSFTDMDLSVNQIQLVCF